MKHLKIRLMINFLNRTLAAFHWSQTIHRYSNERFREALDSYNKLAKLKEPKSVQLAYFATLQIALGNSHLAKVEFGKVLDRISNLPETKLDDNSKYVENYAKMYLSLIKQSDDHRTYWSAAKDLSPQKPLRRWLPLPDEFEFEEG